MAALPRRGLRSATGTETRANPSATKSYGRDEIIKLLDESRDGSQMMYPSRSRSPVRRRDPGRQAGSPSAVNGHGRKEGGGLRVSAGPLGLQLVEAMLGAASKSSRQPGGTVLPCSLPCLALPCL